MSNLKQSWALTLPSFLAFEGEIQTSLCNLTMWMYTYFCAVLLYIYILYYVLKHHFPFPAILKIAEIKQCSLMLVVRMNKLRTLTYLVSQTIIIAWHWLVGVGPDYLTWIPVVLKNRKVKRAIFILLWHRFLTNRATLIGIVTNLERFEAFMIN